MSEFGTSKSSGFETSTDFEHFGQIFYDSIRNINGRLLIRDRNIDKPYAFNIADAYELGSYRILELYVPPSARTPLVKCQILGSCVLDYADRFVREKIPELRLKYEPDSFYGEIYMGRAILFQEVLSESDYTTGNPSFCPVRDFIRCYDGFRVEPPS